MSRQQTFLGGAISLEPSYAVYAAWVTGNTALWAIGDNPREAIGNLIQTHPDEIIAAIQQQPRPAPTAERQGEG